MPNLRGGKAYKKSKGKSKAGDDDEKVIFLEKEPDQLVGRITKLLGNLNMTIYCEDKEQRICKVRSGIKKKVRFGVGDIVLISLRDCEVSKADLEKGIRSDRGDIIDRYHPKQFASLKEEGINPLVFANLETIQTVTNLLQDGQEAAAEAILSKAEDFFERSDGSDESDSSDELNIDDI